MMSTALASHRRLQERQHFRVAAPRHIGGQPDVIQALRRDEQVGKGLSRKGGGAESENGKNGGAGVAENNSFQETGWGGESMSGLWLQRFYVA